MIPMPYELALALHLAFSGGATVCFVLAALGVPEPRRFRWLPGGLAILTAGVIL